MSSWNHKNTMRTLIVVFPSFLNWILLMTSVASSHCLKIIKNVAFLIFLNFGIFHQFDWFLSTLNVNLARFARNVEWDFFYDFQTLWMFLKNFTVQFLPICIKKIMFLWKSCQSSCVRFCFQAYFLFEISNGLLFTIFESDIWDIKSSRKASNPLKKHTLPFLCFSIFEQLKMLTDSSGVLLHFVLTSR